MVSSARQANCARASSLSARWRACVLGGVHRVGFPAVALMGCSLSKAQEELLTAHFQSAWVCLDGDEAGRNASKECAERLVNRMFIKVAELGEGKQPDTLTGEELQKLFTGGKISYQDAVAAADNPDELKLAFAGVSRGL